jgi:hypothetical protein
VLDGNILFITAFVTQRRIELDLGGEKGKVAPLFCIGLVAAEYLDLLWRVVLV